MDPVRALLAKDNISSAFAAESWVGIGGGGAGLGELASAPLCAKFLLIRCNQSNRNTDHGIEKIKRHIKAVMVVRILPR